MLLRLSLAAVLGKYHKSVDKLAFFLYTLIAD